MTGTRLSHMFALSFFGVSVCALAIGCGGGDESGANSPSIPSPTVASNDSESVSDSDAATESKPAAVPTTDKVDEPPVATDGSGSFSGRVLFDGTPPELDLLVRENDPDVKDKEVCGAHNIPDESLLVGEDNGIANVVVFLRKAPKGFSSEPPAEAVVLDQKGCRFLPHVLAVQVGQTVKVVSADGVQHNVHSFPKRNQGVNVLMKGNDREGLKLVYKKAESEPVSIRCDIHSWMTSYQVVTDHPFVAITDETGRFTIEGVPAGRQEFRVWHEKCGFLERKLIIDIPADGTAEKQLSFGADKFAVAPVRTKAIVVSR